MKILIFLLLLHCSFSLFGQNRIKGTVWTTETKNFNPSKLVWLMRFEDNSRCIHYARIGNKIIENLPAYPYKIMGDTIFVFVQKDSEYPDYANVHVLSKDGKLLKNLSLHDPVNKWHWRREFKPGVVEQTNRSKSNK